MPLSYPLSLAVFADLLPIQSAPFLPKWQEETSGLGSGELLTAELAPRLYEADVMLKAMPNTEARGLKALVEAAKDGAFYFTDPASCYPTRDPGGIILGAAVVTVLSVNADNIRLALDGLPAGYVLDNDLIAIDYGTPSRRTVVRMIGTATADGAGETPQFEVRPALRPGIAAGDAVTLSKPAIKAVMVGDPNYEHPSVNRTRISFRIRQTLASG